MTLDELTAPGPRGTVWELEFNTVYLMGLQQLDVREEVRVDELRLLYVGMTRATHALHLSAAGASRIVDKVEAALARLEPLAA